MYDLLIYGTLNVTILLESSLDTDLFKTWKATLAGVEGGKTSFSWPQKPAS